MRKKVKESDCIMPWYLKLNLQFFAEDDGSGAGGNDNSSGEDDVMAAIKALLESDNNNDDSDDSDDSDDTDDSDDNDDDDDDDSDDSDDDNSDDDDDDNDDDDSDDNKDDDQDDKAKGKKREQSKEENARFAAERRERELQERVQRELEKLKQESPEYQLAKQLAEMSGQTPEQMMAQMREAALQKQAEETKVPIEVLRQQQEQQNQMTKLQEELNNLRFQNWQTQIKADTEKLKGQYKMLTQEDFDKATDYILNVARNVNLPLEDAVYAVHGKKIIEALSNSKYQEDLAKQSGRSKKTPPKPNNTKNTDKPTLTAEERYVAKAMGMTEAEYLKYKI